MFSLSDQTHQTTKISKKRSVQELSQTEAVHVCLVSQYGKSNDSPGFTLSSPILLWVQYIPVTLHFTLHVDAVTAAHHYGPAWANFNGCHRQQEKMQACQRKQQTEAKKDGLLFGA